MKVIITFTFCCDNLPKSKFMALEKSGKLQEFFSSTFWPPWLDEQYNGMKTETELWKTLRSGPHEDNVLNLRDWQDGSRGVFPESYLQN